MEVCLMGIFILYFFFLRLDNHTKSYHNYILFWIVKP